MTSFILIVISAINLFALIMMKEDKRRAIKGKYRIAEKTLWLTAICGGGIGAAVGMYLFHHKTKHPTFKLGFPLIAILQAVLYLFLLKWSYHTSFFDKL